jgi:putative hemolysin
MPQDLTLQLLLIAGLVLLNAFFAAAEIAIVSVRRSRLRQLVEAERDPRAAAVQRLVDEPGRFLATIQIGVTLAGFFASAAGAVSLAVALGGLLATAPIPIVAANSYGIAFVTVTVAISFITLVLGELAPKNLAIQNAEAIALRVARPIELLARIAAPLVWLLAGSTNLVMRLAGRPEPARVPAITQEEILAMVASGAEAGVIEPAERELISDVFAFGETTAAEVMVPRVDVRAIPKEATVAEAWRVVLATGHTRLPVYEGDLDQIVGVIHAKDLLRQVDPETIPALTERPVTGIMRPAYHVPASKRVVELLAELQRQRLHLAVLVDEYGGTAGIVTLDNLLEELVGPIRDEYDAREEPEIQAAGAGELIVSGVADLDDVAAALGVKLDVEDVDTVGGLVYSRLGRIPTEGDIIALPQAVVRVLAMRGRRVWQARISRRGEPGDGAQAAS